MQVTGFTGTLSLLYWYQSTNTDSMKEADMQAAAYEAACRRKSSVHSLYWYKVQILTA
jgi:hypothetical protein